MAEEVDDVQYIILQREICIYGTCFWDFREENNAVADII